jgi:hypothetical protein
MLTEQNALERIDAAAAALQAYPGGHHGRGVVVPGGGPRYFPCTWVCINMLREAGCDWPVELWHLGPAEMTDAMRSLVEPLGVRCVDALEVRRSHPARRLGGWELKCYAILHSSFQEVLLLDADNVPLVNPAYLFDAPEYRKHGAVFWPDYGRLAPARPVWNLTGVPYRDEPEFETGQVVVDKARCWGPLSLAMWMNGHSDFWYRHVHGDKDTFHLAWRKLGAEYAMPPYPIRPLPGVMCQHDFAGRRVFQHRNLAKWTLHGHNPRVPGFLHEDLGLAFLDDLRRRWAGRPRPYRPGEGDERTRRAAEDLCDRPWVYRRMGHDERPMTFRPDGTVGEGAAGCERAWGLTSREETFDLSILGRDGVTCVLTPDGPARWHGAWVVHERMPVELVARR